MILNAVFFDSLRYLTRVYLYNQVNLKTIVKAFQYVLHIRFNLLEDEKIIFNRNYFIYVSHSFKLYICKIFMVSISISFIFFFFLVNQLSLLVIILNQINLVPNYNNWEIKKKQHSTQDIICIETVISFLINFPKMLIYFIAKPVLMIQRYSTYFQKV